MEAHEPNLPDRVAFRCDEMLGSLARWLRFFGYDSVFVASGGCRGLPANQACDQGRWFLTRNRDAAATGPRTLLVRSELLDDQMVEVFSRLGLHPEPTLDHSRCGVCNGRLIVAEKADVVAVTPPHVLATATRFRRCLGCARVYWSGSHSSRIVARMEKIVAALD